MCTFAPSLNATQQASRGLLYPLLACDDTFSLPSGISWLGPTYALGPLLSLVPVHSVFCSPPPPIASSSLAVLPLLALFPHPACLPCDLPLLLINCSELVFGQLCNSNLLLPLPFAPDQWRFGRTNCRQTAPPLPLEVSATADSLMAVVCTLNPSKMLFPGWSLLQTPVSQGCEEVKSLASRTVSAGTLLRAPVTPGSSFFIGKCVQGLYPALPSVEYQQNTHLVSGAFYSFIYFPLGRQMSSLYCLYMRLQVLYVRASSLFYFLSSIWREW